MKSVTAELEWNVRGRRETGNHLLQTTQLTLTCSRTRQAAAEAGQDYSEDYGESGSGSGSGDGD